MKNKISVRSMALCALFVALISVGAYIKIPTPLAPITLQTFFVLLAGILLGGRLGALSSLGYMVLGLAGMPVFTGGGGLSYIFTPVFGYILGFCAGAFIAGLIAKGKPSPSFMRLFAAGLGGLGVIYIFGVTYYYLISVFYLGNTVEVKNLFIYCFLIFVPGDTVLCLLSAAVARRMLAANLI